VRSLWRRPVLALATAVLVAAVLVGSWRAERLQADPIRTLDPAGAALVVAALAVTLGLRRRSPAGALAAAVLLVNGYLLIGYPYGPVQLCVVVAMYEVGRRRTLRDSSLICGLAAVVTSAAVYARLTHDVGAPWLLAVAWSGWLAVPWLLGALVRAMILDRDRSRRHLLTQGALAERSRIAAEVHDVAGHGFALVTMQAGVALLVLDEQPEQARRSLEAIRTTGTQSLAALRGMLDALDGRTAGLEELGELIEQVRAGGLRVRLGPPPAISAAPEVGAATYRIVQEALTNVVRHAGPTTAEVSLAPEADSLVVTVSDRGRGCPAPPSEGRGLGGMRRRAEAAGGSFRAGPRAGGGFQVEARLPLAAEEECRAR
jgi:signal transduction histidine kinase